MQGSDQGEVGGLEGKWPWLGPVWALFRACLRPVCIQAACTLVSSWVNAGYKLFKVMV
jgi:hypothetical protein